MHAGTIEWNGLDLAGLGTARLGISRQADPPAPAFPTREICTLKVAVDLAAMDPGTVQARVEHLQKSMQVAEGILRCGSGTGHALEWMAVPAGDNLTAVLGGHTNTLELNFTARENHAAGAVGGITAASFTPAGSGSPITLHAARDVQETIGEERHSPRASARKLTTHTISFTARVAQANMADPLATRLAYLQAEAEAMQALDCREGTLVFGATNRIVRVTEFAPVMDEARGVLDLRVQCFYSVLPDPEKAEVGLDIKKRVDAGSGEEVISLSGTIEAETRAIALAKLDAIRLAQMTTGRRMVSYETSDKQLDGADTDGISGADWPGMMSFSIELRAARNGSHYTLKISSAKDIRSGMRWTYSGTITSANEAAALALARSLVAATGHPVRTKAEETIERVSNIYVPATGSQGAPHFVKLDFSYEFEGPSDGFIGGEISTDRNLPLFGEWRRSLSGFLVAASRAIAETRLNLLLASEGPAIERTLKWSETYLDESGGGSSVARVFQKLDFSAGSRETRTNAAVKYTDATSSDKATMLQQRTISGTIWTDTRANAETALDELILAIFGAGAGTQPTRVDTTHHHERWGNTGQVASTAANAAYAAQMDFTLGRTSKIAGTVGHDIIEASYTMERVGSISNTVITPIPYGRPNAQPGTGYLPGTLALNASCKAVLKTTARAWVQGKMALVNGIGTSGVTRHMTAQPRESLTPEMEPFSGEETLTFTFTGNYQWTFTGTVLDDLWPVDFLMS